MKILELGMDEKLEVDVCSRCGKVGVKTNYIKFFDRHYCGLCEDEIRKANSNFVKIKKV